MRIEYDREADAAYIQLVKEIGPGGVHKTVGCDPSEVGGMINLDFDSSGRLIGIEILDASEMLSAELLASAEEAQFKRRRGGAASPFEGLHRGEWQRDETSTSAGSLLPGGVPVLTVESEVVTASRRSEEWDPVPSWPPGQQTNPKLRGERADFCSLTT